MKIKVPSIICPSSLKRFSFISVQYYIFAFVRYLFILEGNGRMYKYVSGALQTSYLCTFKREDMTLPLTSSKY